MRVSVTRDDMKDEVCVYCSPLATKGTRRSLSAVTPIAAALLAVAVTDVGMYVINNSEVKQTTATYYLHAKLSPTTASLPTTAPIRPSALAVVAADMRASVTRDDMKDDEV